MTLSFKIPVGGKAYLLAERDVSDDQIDVTRLVVVPGAAAAPATWAFWALEETSNPLADATGNGYSLTMQDGATSAAGLLGNGIHFPSHAGPPHPMLTRATGPDLSGDPPFSFVFWFYAYLDESSPEAFQVPLDMDLGNDSGEYPEVSVYRNGGDPSGKLRVGAYVNNAVIDSAADYDPGEWHLAVLTWDGETLTLKVDDAVAGTDTTAPGIVDAANTVIFETSDNEPVAPSCTIDGVGVYLEAISDEYATALWNAGAGWSPY
jgi:hypothetical protein